MGRVKNLRNGFTGLKYPLLYWVKLRSSPLILNDDGLNTEPRKMKHKFQRTTPESCRDKVDHFVSLFIRQLAICLQGYIGHIQLPDNINTSRLVSVQQRPHFLYMHQGRVSKIKPQYLH